MDPLWPVPAVRRYGDFVEPGERWPVPSSRTPDTVLRIRSVVLAHPPEKIHFLFSRSKSGTRFHNQQCAAEAQKTAADQAQSNGYAAVTIRPCRGQDANRDCRRNEHANCQIQAG